MHVSLIDCSISSQAQPSHRTEQSKPRGGPPLSREKSRDVLEQPPEYLLKQEDSS